MRNCCIMFQRPSQLEIPSAVPVQGPLFFPGQGLWSCQEGTQLLTVIQIYNNLWLCSFFLSHSSWWIWILFPFVLQSLFLSDRCTADHRCLVFFFFFRLLLVLILLVTVGFFPTPDLSKRSLETVLLHLSFWPVAPFCISFSSIPPQISLTLQSPLALWEHSLTVFFRQPFWFWPKTVSAPSHSLLSLWYPC